MVRETPRRTTPVTYSGLVHGDMVKGRKVAKQILQNQNNEYKFQDLYTLVKVHSIATALIEAFQNNDETMILSFFNFFWKQLDLMDKVMDQYEINAIYEEY